VSREEEIGSYNNYENTLIFDMCQKRRWVTLVITLMVCFFSDIVDNRWYIFLMI